MRSPRELPGSSRPHARYHGRSRRCARPSAELAQLDILVNNAGIGLVGNIEETELVGFRAALARQRDGHVSGDAGGACPSCSTRKGCVVNIGSVAGLVGVKRRFAYCATKGAVVAMTRQLAVDYAGTAARELHLSRERWRRRSSKATSRSSTSTRRRRCARNCMRASRSAAWDVPKKSPTWRSTWLGGSGIRHRIGDHDRRRLDRGIGGPLRQVAALDRRTRVRRAVGRSDLLIATLGGDGRPVLRFSWAISCSRI